jgi:hypothetical protein
MPNPETMVVLDPEGNPREMSIEQAAAALESPGWRVQTDVDRRDRLTGEAKEEVYGGVGGKIGATLAAGARGFSAGGSDFVIDQLGGGEELRNLREVNPELSTAAEIGGSLVTPGFGLASSTARTAKALSTTSKIGGAVKAGVIEGGVQAIGQTVTEVSLSENSLDVEQVGASLLRNARDNIAVGGGVMLAGAGASRALKAAKGKLDDLATRTAGKADGSVVIADDLTKLDGPALRQAEKTELASIEQAKVPQRAQIADEIKAHRTTAKDEKIFLSTKDAKTWEGIDEKFRKEIREVGKVSLEADKAIDRALRNPKALASNPRRALDALQQQESALETLISKRAQLEDVFKADASKARVAALDGAERALQRNKDLQAKIGGLSGTPTSPRLDQIAAARDSLSGMGGRENFVSKMAGGTAYSTAAGIVGAIPVIGPFLAPFAGTAASNAVSGKLGGVFSKAAGEAASRASKAVDLFLTVGKKAAPAAPILATKVLQAVRYAEDDEPKAKKTKEPKSAPRLADVYRTRTDEIKRQVAYQDGAPKMRIEARESVARSLAPVATSDPILADKLESLAARRIEYLAGKIPRRPDIAAFSTGKDMWQPSDFEMRAFARTVAAVEDPHAVFERVADGSVTPEDAEAMKTVYPEMYADFVQQVLTRIGDLRETLPFSRRLALSIFTDVPVDPSMDPRVLGVLQASFTSEPGTEGGTQAPMPAPAFGSVKNQEATASQRREGIT